VSARRPRLHTIVAPVDDIDHAEVTTEVAAQGGIDGHKGNAYGVVELGMPKMGTIRIQWFLTIGQQIPGITWQIFVHTLLWNHMLGRIEFGHAKTGGARSL